MNTVTNTPKIDTRSRAYCFIINNPTGISFDQLKRLEHSSTYLIYQIEKGKDNTNAHSLVYGYVYHKQVVRFSTMTNKLSTAHITIAKDSAKQNKIECSKNKGHLDGPFEFGIMPAQGKRNDLEDVKQSTLDDNLCTKRKIKDNDESNKKRKIDDKKSKSDKKGKKKDSFVHGEHDDDDDAYDDKDDEDEDDSYEYEEHIHNNHKDKDKSESSIKELEKIIQVEKESSEKEQSESEIPCHCCTQLLPEYTKLMSIKTYECNICKNKFCGNCIIDNTPKDTPTYVCSSVKCDIIDTLPSGACCILRSRFYTENKPEDINSLTLTLTTALDALGVFKNKMKN